MTHRLLNGLVKVTTEREIAHSLDTAKLMATFSSKMREI
jgi:hypothetical protein